MLNYRLTLYTLHASADGPAFATTDSTNIGRVVESITGRAVLSYPSVLRKLRASDVGRGIFASGAKGRPSVWVRRATAPYMYREGEWCYTGRLSDGTENGPPTTPFIEAAARAYEARRARELSDAAAVAEWCGDPA